MPPPTTDEFVGKLLERLVRMARDHARPIVRAQSRTLAENLTIGLASNRRSAFLSIPNYWSVFVHDGHGSFGPIPPRKFLVYFPNSGDDPRLRPNPPIRASSRRSLLAVWTQDQWKSALRENYRRRKLGLEPFMVFFRVGPGRVGTPFFEAPMAPFEEAAKDVVLAETDKFMIAFAEALSKPPRAAFAKL